MNNFIIVTTNFIDGSKENEMTQKVKELKDTYKIIGKEDGELKDEINEILEEYLLPVELYINIDSISTLNAIPDKDRMTIRMVCGTEMTIEEALPSFLERVKQLKEIK